MSGVAFARVDSADPIDEVSGVCVADHRGVYAGEAKADQLAGGDTRVDWDLRVIHLS